MSMRSKFEDLVRDLDKENLEELKRLVADEMEGRRQQGAFKIEDIHPEMSAAEKDEAARQIARVLRGED